MTCFHCGADAAPLIADQICVDCAADATLGRNLFAAWRYLVPQEAASVGDERREHRTDGGEGDGEGWKIVLYDFQPLTANDHGRYRRKVRMADTAKRYLDPGEPVRAGDWLKPDGAEEYIPVPIGQAEELVAQDHFAVIRPLYASFPPTVCACPADTRVPVSDDPEAAACRVCGRIWAPLPDGVLPDVVLPAEPPKAPCDCANVRILPDTAGDPLKNIRAVLRGERRAGPVRLECKSCGALWAANAWHARNSPYPDLAVHDRVLVRNALRNFATGPRHLAAANRYLLRAQQHRWKSRLRKGVVAGLGKAAAERIDEEFEQAIHLLKARDSDEPTDWSKIDPVLAEDSMAMVEYLKDTLSALEDVFRIEVETAYNARMKVLDDTIIQHGGNPFFFGPPGPDGADEDAWWQHVAETWDPKDGPYPERPPEPPLPAGPHGNALVEVADLLRPVYAYAIEGGASPDNLPITKEKAAALADSAPVKRVIQLVGNLPGPVLKNAFTAVLAESPPDETVLLMTSLLEHVSVFEDSHDVDVTRDLSGLVEAVGPSTKAPSTTGDFGFKSGRPIHVLPPGETIREGDRWDDEGVARPVLATVGKPVPGLQALEEAGEVACALRPAAVFFRPIGYYHGDKGEPLEAAADPYRELRLYTQLEGKSPDDVPPDQGVDETITLKPTFTNAAELESALRALYAAAGLKVVSFTVDRTHRVARLVLMTGNTTRTIAVPLPPEIE